MKNLCLGHLSVFRQDEEGSATIWSVFWCIIFLFFAGLAIDASNAYRYKMILQVTADSSALAAAIAKSEPARYAAFADDASGTKTAEERAVAAATKLAERNVDPTRSGTILSASDIRFGTWADGVFTEGAGNAVKVTTKRVASRDNAVPTFLLKLYGVLPSWDIATSSVAEAYTPPCVRNGIITLDVVDFQSKNTWYNGICIHGENGIEVNQNNTYMPGVRVSLPSMDLLTVPAGDMKKNPGLEEALAYGSIQPKLAMQADDIIAGLTDLSSDWQPDYIRDNIGAQVITIDKDDFDPETLAKGNVYDVSCAGNGNDTLNLRGVSTTSASIFHDGFGADFALTGLSGVTHVKNEDAPGQVKRGGGSDDTDGTEAEEETAQVILEQVVIVTDCKVSFDKDTILQDAIVATSNTDAKSVQGSAGVSIGKPDSCATGGGAQIVTAGGMHFAAKMSFHGSQLVAKGEVSFGAQVNGLEGTAVETLSRVDLSSNNDAGLCEGEADRQFESYYYRLRG